MKHADLNLDELEDLALGMLMQEDEDDNEIARLGTCPEEMCIRDRA